VTYNSSNVSPASPCHGDVGPDVEDTELVIPLGGERLGEQRVGYVHGDHVRATSRQLAGYPALARSNVRERSPRR
jgi:hypothetical protein